MKYWQKKLSYSQCYYLANILELSIWSAAGENEKLVIKRKAF